MYVIGTAGHVDHGKTALIQALTGIDPDRLPEERKRGMTIDLGFAHFDGPDGKPIGIIDVPGHEGFLRNMVAGAYGVDLALFVVSVVEGWQQQSADHARVLRLLGVKRIVLVLSKADAAPPERIAEVRQQAIVHCGSMGYIDPPSIEVSAVTGMNIEVLRELVIRELRTMDSSGPGRSEGFPLVYIDRIFVMQGVGVIVTGTLRGASLKRGMDLLLLPAGKKVRVRSLQCYQKDVEAAEPVSRVALNLPGLKKEDLRRGDCLIAPDGPARIERELLAYVVSPPDATELELKKDVELEVAYGTAHRLARLHRLDKLEAGKRTAVARLVFAEPVAVIDGQYLLLLRHGGSTIIGGCRVIQTGASTREQRQNLVAAATTMPSELQPEQLASLQLALRGWARCGEIVGLYAEGLSELGEWVILPELRRTLEKEIMARAGRPGGAPINELQTQASVPAGLVDQLCAGIIKAGKFVLRQGILCQAEPEQQPLSPLGKRLLSELKALGLAGVELAKTIVPGAQTELRTLAKSGLAVSLDGNIFMEPSVYDGLVRGFLDGLATGSRQSLADCKLRTGLSRKYLIPFLNKLELEGYVKRNGDDRVATGKVYARP